MVNQAYQKEAGRVSGVVEEHPGGAVHPDHDHGTVQVVGVVAEEPGDVHQGGVDVWQRLVGARLDED